MPAALSTLLFAASTDRIVPRAPFVWRHPCQSVRTLVAPPTKGRWLLVLHAGVLSAYSSLQ